eukprot:gene13642-17415_t
MDKFLLHQQVLERLAEDLLQAEQAAQAAHETATHEENIAENKYDTLGLEAAYLAVGQVRRAEGIRQALVISGEAPLGRAMLGKCEGDEVWIQVAPIRQQFEVLR